MKLSFEALGLTLLLVFIFSFFFFKGIFYFSFVKLIEVVKFSAEVYYDKKGVEVVN